MLGKNESIVFNKGEVTFQTERGHRVSGTDLASRPLAHIDRIVVGMFGDYLTENLGCFIEVEHGINRFSYKLLSDPDNERVKKPKPFEIALVHVNLRLGGVEVPVITTLESVLNLDGVKLFTWLLEALFAPKKFTVETTDGRLCWSPPPKMDGYTSLTKPKSGEPSQLEKIMAVISPLKQGPVAPPKKK
jgi:hypothetical protein